MRNTGRRTAMIVTALVLVVAGAGLAQAQMPMAGGSGMMNCPMMAAGGGAGPAMPDEAQRMMIQNQLKFMKDNSALMAGLMQKRLELHLLMLDSMPNVDQVAAKMTDINKDEMQLQTRMLDARIAAMKAMPAGMRGRMMKMMRMGMTGMMGAGMMNCPMMGGGMMGSGTMGGMMMGAGMMGQDAGDK